MAHVFKRADSPIWYASLDGPNGRLKLSTGCRSKSAARAWLNARLAAMARAGDHTADGRAPVTLGAALDQYAEALSAAAKPSAGHVRSIIGKITGALDGRFGLSPEMHLHDITTADLERLRVARQREGNSAQTIAHELKTIRAASHYAKRLRQRHAENVDRWALPKLAPKTRYLSWEEWSRVYDRLSPGREVISRRGGADMRYRFTDPATMRAQQDVQDLFVALTLTGGRWSEVTAITWDRVNLEKLEVTLWGTHKGTKRTVPIPRQCAEVLLRRHAERDPGNPLVFPGRDGAQRTAGTRAIAKAFTACGLNRPDLVAREGTATIHSLRHTYASWLRQSGVQLDDVSDMLGHASLQMTRRYAAIKPQEQRAVVKAALDNVGH